MKRYRLPGPTKQGPNLSGEALGAAAAYVWSVDSGEALPAKTARALRDALESVLEGANPSEVFPNRRKRGGGKPSTTGIG